MLTSYFHYNLKQNLKLDEQSPLEKKVLVPSIFKVLQMGQDQVYFMFLFQM